MSIYDNMEDGVKNMEKIVVTRAIVSVVLAAATFKMAAGL